MQLECWAISNFAKNFEDAKTELVKMKQSEQKLKLAKQNLKNKIS